MCLYLFISHGWWVFVPLAASSGFPRFPQAAGPSHLLAGTTLPELVSGPGGIWADDGAMLGRGGSVSSVSRRADTLRSIFVASKQSSSYMHHTHAYACPAHT